MRIIVFSFGILDNLQTDTLKNNEKEENLLTAHHNFYNSLSIPSPGYIRLICIKIVVSVISFFYNLEKGETQHDYLFWGKEACLEFHISLR